MDQFYAQKCKYVGETCWWQSYFSVSPLSPYLDIQRLNYVSSSCLTLLVNGCNYCRSVMLKHLCRNLIFRGVFYFFHTIIFSMQHFRKKHLEKGNESISKMMKNFAFLEHHNLRSQIPQPVMFLVLWLVHFLCKYIQSRFIDAHKISLF